MLFAGVFKIDETERFPSYSSRTGGQWLFDFLLGTPVAIT
jgi:hypothetical protein